MKSFGNQLANRSTKIYKTIILLKQKNQNLKKNNTTFAQLLRYGAIGFLTNFIGYCSYLLMVYLGLTPTISMTMIYIVGILIGYFGNRNVTFSYNGSTFNSGLRYALVHIIGYFMNLSILLVFVDRLGYPHQLVQAVAIFTVAAFLFITFKLFVFPVSNNDSKDAP